MSATTLFMYITIVLTFALFPVDGQTVVCQSNYTMIDGECYRAYTTWGYRFTWEEAKARCEQWNGKLARFTTIDQYIKVFHGLNLSISSYWIGAQNEAEEMEFHMVASLYFNWESFTAFSNCPLTYPFVCSENNNITSLNITTVTTTSSTTNGISNINNSYKTANCLYNDSVAFDGQCYRISPQALTWSEANNYCKKWNGALATIYSAKQGFGLLTALDIFVKEVWITFPILSDKHTIANIIGQNDKGLNESTCKYFTYAQFIGSNETYQALCVELPDLATTPITTTEPTTTITPVPTTETKPASTSEATAAAKPTTRAEGFTEKKPIRTEATTATKPNTRTEKTAKKTNNSNKNKHYYKTNTNLHFFWLFNIFYAF